MKLSLGRNSDGSFVDSYHSGYLEKTSTLSSTKVAVALNSSACIVQTIYIFISVQIAEDVSVF